MQFHSTSRQARDSDRAGRMAMDALERSSMRYVLADAVLLSMPVHIALLDSHGTIMAVNEAWKRFIRDNNTDDLAEQCVGMRYLAVSHQMLELSSEEATALEAGLQTVLDGTEARFTMHHMGGEKGATTTQRSFLIEISALAGSASGALVSHIDISESIHAGSARAQVLAQKPIMLAEAGRRRAEAEAKRAAAAIDAASRALSAGRAATTRLRALQSLTDTALSNLALDDLLRQLLARLRSVMRVDNVAILLLDEDGQTFSLRAALGPEEALVGKVKIPIRHGLTGRIVANKGPLIVDDLSTVEVLTPLLQEMLRSIVGVPLLAEGRLVGIVHVGSVTPRHFTDQDVQLLQLAADRIALAVDRAHLFAAEQIARRRAEEALARATASEAAAIERAAELQTLLDTMIDGVAVTNQQGHIIQTNRAFREILALDRVPGFEHMTFAERFSLLQMKDSETRKPLPPEQFPTVRALRGEVVQGPSGDIHVIAPDGRELDLNVNSAPLRDHSGSIIGAVTVTRDNTWSTHLEREREEARASELAMREVTERMNEFIDTAAHDLRSPVTVASTATDYAVSRFEILASTVLARQPDLAHKINSFRRTLEDANRNVDRLRRMVTVLSDTSQVHAGRLSLHRIPCDLAALLREEVDAARAAYSNREIQLKLRNNRSLYVVLDVERISQVISNYLSNALKYSPEDQPVEVRVTTRKSQVQVSVQDHGPGMPASEQEHIWQRFYRVQGTSKQSGADSGLGLGLHICKTIVEQHGGQVGVASSVGAGSTFWFTLPLPTEDRNSPQG